MQGATRHLALALLAGLLTAPVVASPDAGAATRKRTACERLRGADLAPARKLKVVRRAAGDGSVRVLACTLRGGRVRTIASFTPEAEFESGDIRVVATGDRHALLLETHAERGSGSALVRVDTRTRRRQVITSQSCDPTQRCTGETAAAVALHRSGALAVVVASRLTRVAIDGSRTVLDEGAGIDGLQVDGDAFVWTRDGQARSAPVTG